VTSRARNPVLVIALAAAVPALALGALAAYADAQSDGVSVPVSTTTVVPATLPSALATPVLSLRRAPSPLAADRRATLLAEVVQPLAAAIDGASCLAVGMDDRTVAATNADLPVIPASNLKLLTATAAVQVLGGDTVFTTTVTGAPPVNGVVNGDLYLVGGGDPLLSEEWYTRPSATRKRPPLHATGVEALADQLVAAGITSVTGGVVGDGSRYDDELHPPGWSNDIRASVDGVPVGALVVNDSVSQSGAIASDPAASAASTLRTLLRARGIAVGGRASAGSAPPSAAVLASVASAPMTDVVNEMLATSDNLTAEMLVKEMGRTFASPGTRAAGLQVMGAKLAEWGVPAGAFTLTDGSGLSRDNRITCNALVTVLQRGSATDAVGAAMAKAGDAGSTLDGKFEEPGLLGVLQAKTGSLREVKALCGYFPASGGEVTFALILNGASAANYVGPWQRLGSVLLATATAPSAASLAPR
jgi:D-alanyl-D-alanine carboxypeptidase/D-alanyl-D-alanine-endopeptidase (penicillin-binding protein 4)